MINRIQDLKKNTLLHYYSFVKDKSYSNWNNLSRNNNKVNYENSNLISFRNTFTSIPKILCKENLKLKLKYNKSKNNNLKNSILNVHTLKENSSLNIKTIDLEKKNIKTISDNLTLTSTEYQSEKKRNNYKELLYDPILEHIGREEKPNPNKNNEFEEMSSISENSKKNEKNEKNKKVSSTNTNKNKQKSRTKTGKHSRKKQHKITLKNNKDILADLEENKNNQYNTKYTKVIFHGQNYQETKNVNEFMKYNFDFITDEQYKTKKLITDYSQQHIDVKTLNGNTNIYDNYNYSEQHLDEIKNKWSRAKFLGDNKELKKAINIIRDSFNERKIYTNEEKYLDILKKNNYSLNGIDDENK
jgi:hypothetical protein